MYNIIQISHNIISLLITPGPDIRLYGHGQNLTENKKKIWTLDLKQDTRPGQNTVSTVQNLWDQPYFH